MGATGEVLKLSGARRESLGFEVEWSKKGKLRCYAPIRE
uniref:Uncharacterized protein n=1 Tax=Fagus sylvatica TaxID=28930 RepID=A0A2N9GG77_FAGSY